MKSLEQIKKELAVVILAYADYESLELSLASHAKYSVNKGVRIFILQNGRWTYDTERTYSVAKRYHKLFPESIEVVDWIPEGLPYQSIKSLLASPQFSEFNYIIKLDDDVIVLTEDWLDKLTACFLRSKEKYGDQLGYVSCLVNNNPFGFKTLIERCPDLADEYYKKLARPHIVGNIPEDSFNPYRLCPADEICSAGNGTIWQLPYVARWLHEKTTMDPERYKAMTAGWETVELNVWDRYSINCLFFEKPLWVAIDNYANDDELMLQQYCLFKDKKCLADLSVPMVHLAFASQRQEIRDMIPAIRNVYTEYLRLPFPIAMCEDRSIEIENRLRFLEKKLEPKETGFSAFLSKSREKLARIKGKVVRKLTG